MTNGSGVLKMGFRWAAGQLFRCLDGIVPKDKRIVLVTQPDGDDQGVALCLALERAHWDGAIDWLVHEDPADFPAWQRRRGLSGISIRFLRLHSIRGVWAYFKASHVFYTHGAVFNYAPPKRKLVVNMWHGMPVKKIWRGVPGSQLPLSTFLISTSAFFSDVLMQASGFGPERMLATGLPRNDILLTERPESASVVARLRGDADRLGAPERRLRLLPSTDVALSRVISIERDRELIDDGVYEQQIGLVEGPGPFDGQGPKRGSFGNDQRKNDESLGKGFVDLRGSGQRGLARTLPEVDHGRRCRTYQVAVRGLDVRLDGLQLLHALIVGRPNDPRGASPVNLGQDRAAKMQGLGRDPQRRVEGLLDVFEAREQLADLVEVPQSQVSVLRIDHRLDRTDGHRRGPSPWTTLESIRIFPLCNRFEVYPYFGALVRLEPPGLP